MTKIIISIFAILTFSMCYGQYDWREGKIVLTNGQTLKGIVKMSMPKNKAASFYSSKVQYKRNWKGKAKKIENEEIEKVFYGTFNPEVGYFEFAPITKKKKELLKVILNGKTKLYKRTIKSVSYTGEGINSNAFPRTSRKKDIQFIDLYYIIRNGELSVTYIPDISLKEFKEKTINYFSDCKKIIEYIESNLYAEYEIIQLVEDYNIFCE